MERQVVCADCGENTVLRTRCFSALEHLLDWIGVSPFRCQFCCHRFFAFRLGRLYPRDRLDRRQHPRFPVRLSLALSGSRTYVAGMAHNLSIGGCLIEADIEVRVDDLCDLQIQLSEQLPPVDMTTTVRSVRGRLIGLKFLESRSGEHLLFEFLEAQAGEPMRPLAGSRPSSPFPLS